MEYGPFWKTSDMKKPSLVGIKRYAYIKQGTRNDRRKALKKKAVAIRFFCTTTAQQQFYCFNTAIHLCLGMSVLSFPATTSTEPPEKPNRAIQA